MDPASAVGIASSAIAFLEFTYHFVSTLYEIYDVGKPRDTDTLEEVSQRMEDLSSDIQSRLPNSGRSKDDDAIFHLSQRCQHLSRQIINCVARTKAKNKDRFQDIFKAAMKTVCTKDKIVQLRQNLDDCRAQLQMHFLADQRQALHRVEDDLSRVILGCQESINQKCILDALGFAEMDERYHDISKAAEKTFEWIFKDEEDGTKNDEESEEEHEDEDDEGENNYHVRCPTVKHSFIQWLASGNGIFHISGKPGSGKSTLMKYLYQNPRTTKELQNWAGAKKLILARFFFWKPGKRLQKDFRGLTRSILYHILNHSREVIPSVFSLHWDPTKYNFWDFAMHRITLGDDEIQDAFNELIESHSIFQDNSFCFFIDGLDEFVESHHTYGDLVERLKKWVQVSQNGIKICVSSREYPAFEAKLDRDQRIRLQDLTTGDIEALVHQRLDGDLRSSDCSLREREMLVSQIVDRADGVFLWVAVTLKVVRQGLENKDQFEDLTKKIEDLPTELDQFFSYILDSIDKGDRKKAFWALAFAMGARRLEQTPVLPLFRYHFLMKMADDPEFAKKLPQQKMAVEEVDKLLHDTAAQLKGRCKGLLEWRESTDDDRRTLDPYTWRDEVKFTHRSIPELLDGYLENRAAKHLVDFDTMYAIGQTFLAAVKSVAFGKTDGFHWVVKEDLWAILLGMRNTKKLDKTLYYKSLDALDIELYQKQLQLYPQFPDLKWSAFHPTWSRLGERTYFMSVLHEAAFLSFDEYIAWKAQICPQDLRKTNGAELVRSVLEGAIYDPPHMTCQGVSKILEWLFQRVSPNCASNSTAESGLSSWSVFLNCMYLIERRTVPWKVVELFLAAGADHPTWYCDTDEKGDIVNASVTVRIGEIGLKANQYFKSKDYPTCLQTEGKATLRDWVDWKQPENAEVITELLDQFEDRKPPKSEANPTSNVNLKAENTSGPLDVFGREPDAVNFTEIGASQDSTPEIWNLLPQILKSPTALWFLLGR